jgi:pyruvate/2-oxoglutarate dehydrogenase complex dihydrolipoamide acyltransferase (E2) component
MMKTILRVPKLAVSMQTGVLASWLVEDGKQVEQGQALYTLEIEKSVMDVEAPVGGVLKRIGVENETYKVGDILGEIESSG